jgi:hypothetical protein
MKRMYRPKRLICVACCKSKLDHRAKVDDIYISDLFKKASHFAWRAMANPKYQSDIRIISAKHGLLNPMDVIDPYDATLSKFSPKEIQEWSDMVITQIRHLYPDRLNRVTFLAGKSYRAPIENHLKSIYRCTVDAPLAGLGIGEQKQWLNWNTKNSHTELVKNDFGDKTDFGYRDVIYEIQYDNDNPQLSFNLI